MALGNRNFVTTCHNLFALSNILEPKGSCALGIFQISRASKSNCSLGVLRCLRCGIHQTGLEKPPGSYTLVFILNTIDFPVISIK